MVRGAPTIHPKDIVAANGPEILTKVTSNTNEFLRVCPTKNVIGVTGTKGKGTTSTLIAKMLETAGQRVHLGGNIGIPPLELLKNDIKPEDWVVLELANFQLIDLRISPHIAVCLMVVPEHLNWHADMAEYILAKSQLFAHQSSDDIAIYYSENDISREVAAAGAGHKLTFYRTPGAFVNGNMITIDGQEVCTTNELKLLGAHNWQNVCAAITAVWQTGVRDLAALRSVATSFSGLPHRLEKVRELDGVTYYNDSFAATPDAAIAALTAIPGKKVLLLGGFDRGLPIDHVAKACAENTESIRKVILLGASAERVKGVFDTAGFTNYEVTTAKTMPEIVVIAKGAAQAGDAILLSPGFASFDMFKNFEDRGLQYKAAVNAL